MQLVAHIENKGGKREIQLLKTHLENTARYARDALNEMGLGNTAYLSGILHDMGKYSDAFQNYIKKASEDEKVVRGSVDHSTAGMKYLEERFGSNKENQAVLEILEYAVMCHHGMADCVNNEESEFLRRAGKKSEEIEYEVVKKRFFTEVITEEEIDNYFAKAVIEIGEMKRKLSLHKTEKGSLWNSFIGGQLIRLVLSAVVYADRRDTREFCQDVYQNDAYQNGFWKNQIDFFEDKISKFRNDTEINRARSYISEQCRRFAEHQEGVYRLNVPTGAGKTLSTLRFALHHAEKYKKKRIIFVIPLLSILEQNSKVIHEYIKDADKILEVHSNVVVDKENEEELNRYELLVATWNQPVVVTTFVQLLQAMFSSKCENVQHFETLTDSVIVIDEVQTIPKKMISMFNMTVNFLVYGCRTTVVLSSATQPSFDTCSKKIIFQENADMVKKDEELWKSFARTIIVDQTSMPVTQLELVKNTREIIQRQKSLLIIVNTRKEAADLYQLLKGEYDENLSVKVEHLSNNMCQEHRTACLKQIKKCLNNGETIICVSTTLIEAGVDFEKNSFGAVIRYKAGLDSIAQAAGRCNRSGEYKKICPVYIVDVKEDSPKMMTDLQMAKNSLSDLLVKYRRDQEHYLGDLLGNISIYEYYQKLFSEYGEPELSYKIEKENTTMYSLLSTGGKTKERMPMKQLFKTAGYYFSVFDNDAIDVVVPYNEEASGLIRDLEQCDEKYEMKKMNELVEKAKPYVVHLFSYKVKQLEEMGMITRKNYCLFLNDVCYDKNLGVIENLNISDFML